MLVEVKVIGKEKQYGVSDGMGPGGGIARGAIATVMAVGFAIVAAPGTAHAYRTAAEDSDLPTTARVAWTTPVRIAIGTRPVRGLDELSTRSAIDLAAATWIDAACGTLDVASLAVSGMAAMEGDGVVTIEPLGDRWASLGLPADVPARTEITFRESGGTWWIADADIYVNDAAFEFALSPTGDQLDVVAILTHELGHALGLAHNCASPGSGEMAPACSSGPDFTTESMYPTYLGPSQRMLGVDDTAGLCFLYPAGAATGCDTTGCPSGYLCQSGACVPDPAVNTCATEADCDAYERCLGGVCAAAVGVIGDPCVAPEECSGGICSTAGRCARSCDGVSSFCPANYECRLGLCSTPLSELDEPCTVGEACASNYCLVGARVDPVCTRLCDTSTPCPLGWSCQELEGRVVCVPQARQSGCTANVGRGPYWPGTALLLALLIVARRKSCRAPS